MRTVGVRRASDTQCVAEELTDTSNELQAIESDRLSCLDGGVLATARTLPGVVVVSMYGCTTASAIRQ